MGKSVVKRRMVGGSHKKFNEFVHCLVFLRVFEEIKTNILKKRSVA